ncbi:ABC transporter substrate-binding protein [Microbacterium rhizophilus]|uniref:ABC transporter substrate-binding protein n=1 Tax=Microbacterium rhizophilus TaxID=3138934 RepID=UPI0031E66450
MKTTQHRVTVGLVLATLAFGLGACSAEAPAQADGDAPAVTTTTDMDALVEAAKAEGTLTLYGDASDASLKAWTDAFTAEYGISATIVRNATGPLYQQFAQEASAGQNQADLISLLDHTALDQAIDNKWIAPYTPEGADALPAEYARDGYYYSMQNVTVPVIAYNTDKVTPEEVEKLQADPMGFLAQKGMTDRIGVVAPQAGQQLQAYWYLYSDGPAGGDYGWTNLEGIAANTGTISDTVTVGQAVVQGEVDFGLPLADSYVISLITGSGAPLGFVYPDPSVVVTSALAVAQEAPHPNAARLFDEWASSQDGVAAWAKAANNEPMRTDVDDPRSYLEEPWFTPRSDDPWTDFGTDQEFLDAMKADGPYFPKWNETFGYAG